MVGRRRTLTPEMFWRRVNISSDPHACWPWLAGVNARGYGQVRWTIDGRTTKFLAHRVAWYLTHGSLPDPVPFPSLRHAVCGNPPCCNPGHLAPGTQVENGRDMVAHGRAGRGGASGDRNPRCTVADDTVRVIRARCHAGEPRALLAREFGVDLSTIRRIANRQARAGA